jgi:hypothetical protein
MLDLRAAIHDHTQSRQLRFIRSLLVEHHELHPDCFESERAFEPDGFARNIKRCLRIAEDIDHVDRSVEV